MWNLRYTLYCIVIILQSHISFAQKLDSIHFLQKPFVVDKSLLETFQFPSQISKDAIQRFYQEINNQSYHNLVKDLVQFRTAEKLSDWLYYQLIRRVSQSLSSKSENYHRYTLYKWYLMNKSGYDARIAIGNNQIIFYIKNKEDISDIPFFNIGKQQYTCLNYHDYGKLFQRTDAYTPIEIYFEEGKNDFKYKINQMPELLAQGYKQKSINFEYNDKVYNFKIKVNDEVSSIFKNYPGVDFDSYFNIPLTKETYSSLIPVLKENVAEMTTEKGVDYLMRFTRYAFLYEDDEDNFGKEKRLSPELTLLNPYSDCDDRVALFFYLVKEIYNLPMVAILYPTHITMGVQFDKKIGKTIKFEDQYYSICEPTPQARSLNIGELADKYLDEEYKIVYHYSPK
ncbi:hypothetical protein [Sphingobacterium bovistauri]|uniref:Transglutaminase-like superfamily protein n=1 Tax=Sphingobacterium bovistauri TaxID=2781959 RepID=A0ABS7Z9L9_9SPHI|nr:hypothetical protein [Sphingobacterium bovistauri]MCA5006101.1 hypothetical protein [Sphingobacterium bovistauri]